MSTPDLGKASGFAAKLRPGTSVGPPPRPTPPPPAPNTGPGSGSGSGSDSGRDKSAGTVTVEPAVTEAAKTAPTRKPKKPTRQANTTRNRSGGVAAPSTPGAKKMMSTSFQLEPEHIDAIRTASDNNRKFRHAYLTRTLNDALDQLGDQPIPPEPEPEGPDDYRFYTQYSCRIPVTLIERLTDVADTHTGGNRSHVVRYLLDTSELG